MAGRPSPGAEGSGLHRSRQGLAAACRLLAAGWQVDVGYAPASDYAATVADEVDWLVSAARGDDGTDTLCLDEPYVAPLLDYTAEDRYISGPALGASGQAGSC